MFWRKWKTRDLKVHCTGQNALEKIDVKVKDGNLDDLWEYISELWERREEENHRKGRRHYKWRNKPNNPAWDLRWQDLRSILRRYGMTMNIDDVKSILTREDAPFVATFAVAFTLEMEITQDEEKIWDLTEIMYDLAILLKRLSESPGRMQDRRMQDVIQEATTLMVKGASLSYLETWSIVTPYSWLPPGPSTLQQLNFVYQRIINQFTAGVFTPMPHPWRSHLSEKYRAVEVKDGNLDDLWEHIFVLWKLRNKGKHDEARCVGPCTWPHVRGLHKLIQFVSIGTDLPIKEIDGTVKAILDEIGRENAATAAPLVVSHTLERLDDPSTHTGQFFHLVTEMYELAIVLKILSEIPEEIRQNATVLIVEGARVFSLEGGPLRSASKVPEISPKLKSMKSYIAYQYTVGPVLPRIQHQLRSHHSKEYATHTEKVKHINHDELWEHIFKLWELREEGNHEEACSVPHFLWPDVQDWRDLKDIVLLGADDIHEHVETILRRVNVASVAPLLVAHTLETLDASITNTEELWHLIEVMYDLAIVLEELSESSGRRTREVMQEATSLIVEGARVFSLEGGPRRSAAGAMVQLLHNMYIRIKAEFTFPFLTPIQPRRGSYLWKKYLKHAVFKIEALVAATNNFHKDNKVGEGGFGAVYKGTHDGKQIAVKKMSLTSEEERKEFESEKLLAEVQHPNIVKLLGLCEQASQGFLVYEYFPNGSLDKFLFVADKRKELDWEKRYNIILGVACGLSYIHEYSQPRIVHRDIKPSNILLDENLIPKIADFGTAKLFPADRTHVTATNAVGTFGYKAPEYAMHRQITVKIDVYSFGVVLLELLTGEKILSEGFLERVWSSYTRKEVADTIDRTITETWDKEKGEAKAKALRCFQVALLCIQNDAERRPTMSRVITMLSSSDSLSLPTKPPLVFSPRPSFSDEVENDNSTMEK